MTKARQPTDDDTVVVVGHLILPDGSSISISEGRQVVIGRSDQCDVRLAGERVAAQHCVICAGDEHLIIEDLGSEEGTFLNGKRLQRTILEHGDSIRIGDQLLHFTTTAGALRRRRRIAVVASPRRLAVIVSLLAVVGVGGTVAARFLWHWIAGGQPTEAPTRQVLIASEPEGGLVWIDGSYQGKAPLTVALAVKQAHRIKVSRNGCLDWETEVPTGASESRIVARLKGLGRGHLSIKAFPPGATAYLGGRYLGTCPIDADVPAGKQTVRVECREHRPFEGTVNVTADSTVSLRCVLRYEDLDRLRSRVHAAPSDPCGYSRLAQALLTNGRAPEALLNLRVALGLVGSERATREHERSVLETLPGLYLDPPIPDMSPSSLGQFQRELDKVFQAVIWEYPHPATLRVFVEIQEAAGKAVLAESLCEQAMAKAPEAVAPYTCLAELYQRKQRYNDAEAALTLCGAVRRQSREACFALAVAWSKLQPHCQQAGVRAKAELRMALEACLTDEEQRRLTEEFRRLAWTRRNVE